MQNLKEKLKLEMMEKETNETKEKSREELLKRANSVGKACIFLTAAWSITLPVCLTDQNTNKVSTFSQGRIDTVKNVDTFKNG